MTAAVQRQGGGRTPSGQATAPKKPVGRLKGAPSTRVKVRLHRTRAGPARDVDGTQGPSGIRTRRPCERGLEAHESGDARCAPPRWGSRSPVSGMSAVS